MTTTLIWAGLAFPDATTPQSDFAVCVEDSRIIATGAYAEVRARYPTAEQVGGKELILMPTMVNSHDHGRGIGSMALGVADDLLEVWLLDLCSQPSIDPYLAAAYDGLRLLRSGVGTTTHSHNPRDWHRMDIEAEATLRGYHDAGVRVAFHFPVIDQNPLVYNDIQDLLDELPPNVRTMARRFVQPAPLSQNEYFGWCADLLRVCHDPTRHMVHIQVGPAGGTWCSDDLIMASIEFAQKYRTRVQMHLLETRYQARYALRRWGKTFVQHLDEIGALGPWLTLAHMVWVDLNDLPLLLERGVGIVHNPSSNLRLRSGIAPLAEMMQAHLLVGIGLDGHGLDDDQDYLRELRLAWTLSNRPGADAPTVRSHDIWQMGTEGGAKITFGDGAPVGKLAPGYLADLVLLDLHFWASSLIETGSAGAMDMVLRAATRQHVLHVMVDGRWVVRDRQSTTLDEEAIVSALHEDLVHQDHAEQQRIALVARALAPYIRRFYATWDA